VGGVCGGLAEYTGIDPLLWRIGFVALTLTIGVGVPAYLLLWLFLPADDAPPVPGASRRLRRRRPAGPRSPIPRITVAVMLITEGLLVLLDRFTGLHPGPRGFIGAALLVVGLGLIAAAFAPGRTARGGLITVGVLLSVALAAAAAVPWHAFDGVSGVGDTVYRPTTVADVRADYHGGLGDTTIDLTAVPLAELGDTRTIRIDHGVGDLRVLVPRSADVEASVHHGVGDVNVLNGSSDGGFFAGSGTEPWTGDGRAEFDLIINAGLGDVEVLRA
jgi:phage shock protein PspC (stress-responsive transcriptional regulator)